jgi:hypothetical protein
MEVTMSTDEALTILTQMQKWRRDEPPYCDPPLDDTLAPPYSPEQYGRALDAAIRVLGAEHIAKALLMHAVDGIFDGCGNSYANSYTEEWLTLAKELGAYHGRVIGRINELQDEWEAWLDKNGLPDIPSQNSED